MPVLLAALWSAKSTAEPWLEVGSDAERSDLELLSAYGLIDGPLTTWPIPAGQLEKLNGSDALIDEPVYVRAAADRIVKRLIGSGQPEGLRPEATLRGARNPDFVRGFEAAARDEMDVSAGFVWDSYTVSGAIRGGEQAHLNQDGAQFAPDGTYVAALFGDWQVYGGWVDQWYGPGWISSLILSNNARPMPKAGLMRNHVSAFDLPILRWFGPWQFDTFVGLLDGPRVVAHTGYAAVRLTFEPIHNLEFGLTRTTELCGEGQQCNPGSAMFHFSNSSSSTNSTNDEAAFDLRFQKRLGTTVVTPYFQLMNEDDGPFVHSYTSYLLGTSLAGAIGSDGSRWRFVAEYTDSVAALNALDPGKKIYFASYNNYQYIDGMRYRGRSLGFSLDSDSRLLSLMDQITDAHGRTYRLVFHRADINVAPPAGALTYGGAGEPYSYNSVSSQPAMINEWELGLSIPTHVLTFDISARYQNALLQSEAGGRVDGEIDISYRF